MIVSILVRNTRLTEAATCEGALGTVMERIRKVLEGQAGFDSIEYLWSTDEPGRIAQITRWQSEDDCQNYVRNGGAAMVATIEESAVPTSAYPNGAWVRQTFVTGR